MRRAFFAISIAATLTATACSPTISNEASADAALTAAPIATTTTVPSSPTTAVPPTSTTTVPVVTTTTTQALSECDAYALVIDDYDVVRSEVGFIGDRTAESLYVLGEDENLRSQFIEAWKVAGGQLTVLFHQMKQTNNTNKWIAESHRLLLESVDQKWMSVQQYVWSLEALNQSDIGKFDMRLGQAAENSKLSAESYEAAIRALADHCG